MKPEDKAEIKLTIDGKAVTAKAGSNLIDVAKAAGSEIPHYCYHPALPIAGNCRMCMIEVEGMGQPQIACNMPLKDGMVVHTKSAKAVEARKWTLEFLLANHPLDCPICDKAGECGLQNYSYQHGRTHTDFIEKKRTPKTIPLSERLWLEKDRCILCLRCVQFLREVGGKEELYIKQRGNQAEITTAPGKVVESEYQLNTVDLCPVGALSGTHFRFAERVWNLKRHNSICPMCPRGCNTVVEVKDNKVQRVTPRHNPAVNQYWMCDAGRNHFNANHQSQKRLESSTWNGTTLPFEQVMRQVSDLLLSAKSDSSKLLILVSNWLCNEDLQQIHAFVERHFPQAVVSAPSFKEGGDTILRRWDFGPNAFGVRQVFGKRLIEVGQLKTAFSTTLSFAMDPTSVGATQERVVFWGPYYGSFVDKNAATVAGLAHGEIAGTYTNFAGINQSFEPFLTPPDQAKSVDEFFAQLTEGW